MKAAVINHFCFTQPDWPKCFILILLPSWRFFSLLKKKWPCIKIFIPKRSHMPKYGTFYLRNGCQYLTLTLLLLFYYICMFLYRDIACRLFLELHLIISIETFENKKSTGDKTKKIHTDCPFKEIITYIWGKHHA